MTVLTIFMFESQLMQMPGPLGIFCCAEALGLGTHLGAKCSGVLGGGGGGVTGQTDTCIKQAKASWLVTFMGIRNISNHSPFIYKPTQEFHMTSKYQDTNFKNNNPLKIQINFSIEWL